MSRPACRTCGSANVGSVGALPDSAVFAGVALAKPLHGGTLWRCADCGFVFRDPLLPQSRYEDLYRHGSAEVWDGGIDRPDFDLIRRYMAADTTGGDVLEIGCYTGSLLHSLPKRFRLHGVELNERAARMATSRGIHIVAAAAAELPRLNDRFDTIIACDVIEHLENPLDFLGQLRARLAPGGRVLLTTGNSDAWLWRWLGARFWYCSFPEHLSFVSRSWLQAMAGRVGLRVVHHVPFNYSFAGVRPAGAYRLARTLLYGSSPRFYQWLHRSLRGSRRRSSSGRSCRNMLGSGSCRFPAGPSLG